MPAVERQPTRVAARVKRRRLPVVVRLNGESYDEAC